MEKRVVEIVTIRVAVDISEHPDWWPTEVVERAFNDLLKNDKRVVDWEFASDEALIVEVSGQDEYEEGEAFTV